MDYKLLAGGAIFGLIASTWSTCKGIVWRIANCFIQDVEVDSNVTPIVVGYLRKHYAIVGPYDRKYTFTADYLRDSKSFGRIAFESFGEKSLLFRVGWRFLYGYYAASEKTQNANSQASMTFYYLRSLKVGSFVLNSIDFDDIMASAIRERNEVEWAYTADKRLKTRRHFIRRIPDIAKDSATANTNGACWQWLPHIRLLTEDPNNIGYVPATHTRMLDHLFFPDDVTSLIDEVGQWLQSRELYAQFGQVWKRAWLLYGPGGSGKSALAAAFAHDHDLPLFTFALSELDNRSFLREWKTMLNHVPCIALIEDIDNVFHGRQNIANDQGFAFSRLFHDKKKDAPAEPKDEEFDNMYGAKLNFDVLLNCLDGVERTEGLFTIITTNHIEHVDPALGRPVESEHGGPHRSSRPGRIDRVVELTYMTPETKERMARSILGNFPAELAQVLATVGDLQWSETPAQFLDRCGQLALNAHWQSKRAALATTPAANTGNGLSRDDYFEVAKVTEVTDPALYGETPDARPQLSWVEPQVGNFKPPPAVFTPADATASGEYFG